MESANAKTQRDRLRETLKGLKPDITAKDRLECQAAVQISESSLKMYLTGTIGNNDIAVQLIEFFKKQIAKREAVISA